LLQQIEKEREENTNLVHDLAERYAAIDYDQLDEFNRQIHSYILEGQFVKADSLIRSKGDMNERKESYFKLHESNEQKAAELSRDQQAEKMMLEDIARDCYSKHEIFKMQHMNDSAAYYLEFRASLDTTNVDWLLELGNYVMLDLADYDRSISIYASALSISEQQESQKYVANCANDIGFAYAQKGETDTALVYFQKALAIAQEIRDSDFESTIYLNMADLYTDFGEYEQAMNYYNLALEKVDEADKTSKAIILGNIGNLYSEMGKFDEAEKYVNQAISLIRSDANADRNSTLALLYGLLSSIYLEMELNNDAIDCCNKALLIANNIYDEKHPIIASFYGTLGAAYSNLGDTAKALSYKEKNIELKRLIYGENSPKLSVSYNNLAKLYSKLGRYEEAIELYTEALRLQLIYAGENHFSCAILYNNIGFEYKLREDFHQALMYYDKALAVLKFNAEQGNLNPFIITTLNNMGCVYQIVGEYKTSIEYFRQCLDYAKKIYDKYPPSFYTTVYSTDTSFRKAIEQEPGDKKLKKEYADFLKEYNHFMQESN